MRGMSLIFVIVVTFINSVIRNLKDLATGQAWTSVDLQSVEATDFRSLGPELVDHTLWESLDMPAILAALSELVEEDLSHVGKDAVYEIADEFLGQNAAVLDGAVTFVMD